MRLRMLELMPPAAANDLGWVNLGDGLEAAVPLLLEESETFVGRMTHLAEIVPGSLCNRNSSPAWSDLWIYALRSTWAGSRSAGPRPSGLAPLRIH